MLAVLRIVFGTDWHELSYCIRHEIVLRAAKRQNGLVLIVPEQFSFETEQALCGEGGAAISRYAEVLSFSRLAERSLSVCGGIARPVMDQGGRIMAMAATVEQIQSKLKYFAHSSRRADFLLQMVSMVDELKSYNIDSKKLQIAADQLEGNLAVKIQELAVLFEGYDTRCSYGMQDPRDRLQILYKHVRENGFGKGLELYVDGFFGFTGIEIEILTAFLEQGINITISLCCDNLFEGEQVFESARHTAQILINAANRVQSRVEQLALTQVPSPVCRIALSAFSGQKSENDDCLCLYTCSSPREEVKTICADILQYVRNGGRWRDIAITCADTANLRPIIEAECVRLGIPLFFAEKQPALRTPLINTVMNALRAACGNMEHEYVLAWLKSNYAPISESDSDLLENYVILWSISGDLWEQEWKFHPRGFELNMEQSDFEVLQHLNDVRRRCIEPLLKLRSVVKNKTIVGNYVLAIYDFLQETNFADCVTQQIDQMSHEGKEQILLVTQQLYELLIHALEQLYAVQYDAERNPDDFLRLMEILFSQYQVGSVPAVLDAVTVGRCVELRHRNTKQLFFCGCSEGNFPIISNAESLLNEQERSRLNSVGVELAPEENEQMDRNMMSAYLILCEPEKYLTISVGGGQNAYLFDTLCKLYPEKVRQNSTALSIDFATAKNLGLQMLKEGLEIPIPTEAADYRDKLIRATNYDFGSLSREQVQSLYGEPIRLSPSKIDRYASCRFAFFLRDGLRAMERKAVSFDAPIYGTFVHYVLENTLRDIKTLGGMERTTDEKLQKIAHNYMNAFIRERVSPLLMKSERFTYLLHRNFDEISHVVSILGNELRNSKFQPSDFELSFSIAGSIKPVEIQTKRNQARISGTVDRVDLFEFNKHTYFRVIDYKTGKKSFDYTDILEGKGLQMLIYLFALKRNGKRYYGKEIQPAGVLYVPAHDDLLYFPQKLGTNEIAKERIESHRREGLILNDFAVLQAMEPCGEDSPKLMPYKVSREGPCGNIMDVEQLQKMEKYVNKKLCDMVDEMFEGSVTPNPYSRGSNSACSYCPFGSVCHSDICHIEVRNRKATQAKDFWAQVMQEEQNG